MHKLTGNFQLGLLVSMIMFADSWRQQNKEVHRLTEANLQLEQNRAGIDEVDGGGDEGNERMYEYVVSAQNKRAKEQA
jgi:hypothetical protein